VQTEIPLVTFGLVPWAATLLAVRTDRCDVISANTGGIKCSARLKNMKVFFSLFLYTFAYLVVANASCKIMRTVQLEKGVHLKNAAA